MALSVTTAWRRALPALVLAAVAGLLAAAPATARMRSDPYPPGPGGGLTPTGGRATATDVVVSGNGLQGTPGPRRVSIPAVCWWQPALGSPNDPVAELAAFKANELQTATFDAYHGASWVSWLSKRSYVAATAEEFAAAAAEPAGSLSWYMAVCRDGASETDYMDFLGFAVIGVRYQAFAQGHTPPAAIAPVDLAIYANSLLYLPAPAADRNPKITAAAGASLVGLPTWFWVTDPAAAGGPTGSRSVRARAGTVWAEVTASATSVTISSDAGQTTCTPRQAVTAYAPSTPEASGCLLTFAKASVAHPTGWPVTVRTSWHLAWTGSGGTGADLGAQAHTWNTTVPVAEVQTVVTGWS